MRFLREAPAFYRAPATFAETLLGAHPRADFGLLLLPGIVYISFCYFISFVRRWNGRVLACNATACAKRSLMQDAEQYSVQNSRTLYRNLSSYTSSNHFPTAFPGYLVTTYAATLRGLCFLL